jgi:hypothetical protein
MKGIELPINILIILAVAIIVLIAVVAMFYTPFSTGSSTVGLDTAKSAACQILIARHGCTDATILTSSITVNNFDADKDGFIGSTDTGSGWSWTTASATQCSAVVGTSGDNLASICGCHYLVQAGATSITGDTACKKLCGC